MVRRLPWCEVKCWIDTYAILTKELQFEDLIYRGGSVRSAVNLEFNQGNGRYSGVQINPQGVNGRLSNADLITTATKSFQGERIPTTLHKQFLSTPASKPWGGYYEFATSLLDFAAGQVVGYTPGGLYTNYKIECVSIIGTPSTLNSPVSFKDIALSIETTMRALNSVICVLSSCWSGFTMHIGSTIWFLLIVMCY